MSNGVSVLALLASCFATASLAAPVADESVAKLVKQLESVDSDERAAAAKSLREILKDDPTRRSNDHGRAYWEERVAKVTMGMSHHEVVELLPPNQRMPSTMCVGNGWTCSYSWRLDDYWTISLAYHRSDDIPAPKNWLEGLEDRLQVTALPTLTEQVDSRTPARPNSFTGAWTTWYVNGQPFCDAKFVDNKLHGEIRSYSDNGVLKSTQTYVNGVAHGPGQGWSKEGDRLYKIAYTNDKKSGTHTHWWPNGLRRSQGEYRDGQREGRHQEWDESGLLRSDAHYLHDKRHGDSHSWDDNGQLRWSRQYRNGEVILNRPIERKDHPPHHLIRSLETEIKRDLVSEPRP